MSATLTPWARTYHASGSTALALGLGIVRRDGTIHAFTNIRRTSTLPDFTVRAITIPSQEYLSRGALRVSNLELTDDPRQVDNWEARLVTGPWLPAADIEKLLLRGAPYWLLSYDWRTNTPIRLWMRGTVGVHTLAGSEVVFKMRSLAAGLQQEILPVTSPMNRADWPDPELNWFDLDGDSADGYPCRVTATITSVDSEFPREKFVVASTVGFPVRRFSGGSVKFVDGANAGYEIGVQFWDASDGTFVLENEAPRDVEPGDTILAQIGPPLNKDDFLTIIGDLRYYAGEIDIPTFEQAQRIKQA